MFADGANEPLVALALVVDATHPMTAAELGHFARSEANLPSTRFCRTVFSNETFETHALVVHAFPVQAVRPAYFFSTVLAAVSGVADALFMDANPVAVAVGGARSFRTVVPIVPAKAGTNSVVAVTVATAIVRADPLGAVRSDVTKVARTV